MVVPLRVFIAVPVPDEVRHRIVASLDTVRGHDSRTSGSSGQLARHLALSRRIDDLGYDMHSATARRDRSGGKLNPRRAGLGAFRIRSGATVLWMGLDQGEDALSTLAKTVDTAIDRAEFSPESRPFNPHLT